MSKQQDINEVVKIAQAILGVQLLPWQIEFLNAVLLGTGKHEDSVYVKTPFYDNPWPQTFHIDGRIYIASTTYGRGVEVDITEEYNAWLQSLPAERRLSLILPVNRQKKEENEVITP